MNKTVKTLLELDGIMLATKIGTLVLPKVIMGAILPQYLIGAISLGIVTTGYSRYKIEVSKKKDKEIITENDLFRLED